MPKPRRYRRRDRNLIPDSCDRFPSHSLPQSFQLQLVSQLLHRSVPVCIYLKNRAGRYVWMNAFAKARWQPPPADSIQPLDTDLFFPPSLTLLQQRDHDTLRQGKIRVDLERVQLVSGERITYRAVRIPILDDRQKTWGIWGMCLDLTPECQTIEDLKQDIVHQERTLHMVGHELRNPLWTLAICVQRIEQSLTPAEEAISAWMTPMRGALQRMQRLASDLVDVGQVKNGSLKIEAKNVSLRQILNTVENHSRMESTRSENKLKVHADDPNSEVVCDPTRVQQILSNLLDNAYRYSPPRRSVELSVYPLRESVVFFVDDAGPGVSERMSETVFEPYTTEARFGATQGLGLGLHITKKLVEAQEGRIWFERSPLGGARFAFTLPRIPKTDVPTAEEADSPWEPSTDAPSPARSDTEPTTPHPQRPPAAPE